MKLDHRVAGALAVACATSSSDNTAAIAAIASGASVGAIAAIAATAACCCLLCPIARKKLFGDDEEEEEGLPGVGAGATARHVGLGGLDGPAAGPGTAPASTGINKVSPA